MFAIDGINSGLDTTSIIQAIVDARRAPIFRHEANIEIHNEQLAEVALLSTGLLDYKFSAFNLTRRTTFNNTDTSSSNESLLLASGTSSPIEGSFQFKVAQLAAASQFLSAGHADIGTTALPAGSITLEMGGGGIDHKTLVDDLNGGEGIDRGSVRITDSLSNVADIDLSLAVTVDDIVDAINSSNAVNVTASIQNDGLILTGVLSVSNVGGLETADNLGLTKTAVGGTIVGEDINIINANTSLSFLNDGNGISTLDIGVADDVRFTLSDGSTVDVDLSNLSTIQDVITAINTDADNTGTLSASFNADGKSLRLVDSSGGVGNLSAAALTDGFGQTSGAVRDLGLDGILAQNAATGSTAAGPLTVLNGKRLISTINSVQKDTLNGGSGIADGSIDIIDRQGGAPTTIALNNRTETSLTGAIAAGATTATLTSVAGFSIGDRIRFDNGTDVEYHTITGIAGTTITIDEGIEAAAGYGIGAAVYAETQSLQDVINAISNNTAINVTASFNSENNGLKITDNNTVAPTSALSIAETGVGTTASELGILTGVTGGQTVTTGGSAVSLISAGLIGAESDDYFNGMQITVTGGVNAGQTRTIINYDATTGQIDFDAAFSGNFAAADTFNIDGVDRDDFNGFDLNPKYLSRQTKLSDLNQGDGVFLGTFQVTDGATNFTVDLSSLDSATATLGDVMDQFNLVATGPGTIMSINGQGNGLLVSSGAAGPISIADTNGGTSAFDLNISEDSTGATIDGSFQRTIVLDGTQTLEGLRDAINNLDMDLSVSIVDDGSSTNSFRLNIIGNKTGENSRLTVDYFDDFNNQKFTETSRAQDAALSSGASSPVMILSENNTIEDVVSGVTLTLRATSSETVTVNVSKNIDEIVSEVETFVEKFNEIVGQIKQITSFSLEGETDAEGNPLKGILAGDSTLNNIRSLLFRDLTSLLGGVTAPYNRFSSVGIRINTTGDGLEFDDDVLRSALNTNFDDVEQLFRLGARIEEATELDSLRGLGGVRTVSGTSDFDVKLSDGTNFEVNLDGINSIAGVLAAINLDINNGGKAVASLRADGEGLEIIDTTLGAGAFTIVNVNGSFGASDLGIQTQAVKTDAVGNKILEGFSLRDGLADQVNTTAERVVGGDGLLGGKTDLINTQISDLQDRINTLEERALSERARLERQFASLEQILGQLDSQSSFLQSQLGALNNNQ